MKNKKSERKTYAKPRLDDIAFVGRALFRCALENNSTEEMERVLKKLDEAGLAIIKTEDGNYRLVKKEGK